MKDFDIEKLERKNIYQTPENFFAEMQGNVLKQIVHEERKTKVFSIGKYWQYGIAASVALIGGIQFFIRNEEAQPMDFKNQEIAQKVENTTISTAEEIMIPKVKTIESKENISDYKSIDYNNRCTTKVEPKKSIKNNQPTSPISDNDAGIEQVIASFTSVELAELSGDTEMDIYLDLY